MGTPGFELAPDATGTPGIVAVRVAHQHPASGCRMIFCLVFGLFNIDGPRQGWPPCAPRREAPGRDVAPANSLKTYRQHAAPLSRA